MQAIVAQLICYATHNVLRPKKDLAEVIASYCAPQPPIVYVATYRSMSHDRPRRRAWTSEIVGVFPCERQAAAALAAALIEKNHLEVICDDECDGGLDACNAHCANLRVRLRDKAAALETYAALLDLCEEAEDTRWGEW